MKNDDNDDDDDHRHDDDDTQSRWLWWWSTSESLGLKLLNWSFIKVSIGVSKKSQHSNFQDAPKNCGREA